MVRHRGFLALLVLLPAAGVLGQPREVVVRLAPFATEKSRLLDLSTQERITVSVEGATADIFVHSENQELLQRDDPEQSDVRFEFHAPRPGKYYVLLRNLSEQSGTARILVLPPSTTGRPALAGAEKARVRLFFATDRQKSAAGASPAYFGREPAAGNAMAYGVCEVSIPRSHDMGELEGPSIWRLEFRQDIEKHIVLVGDTLKALDRSTFLREIEERVSTSKDADALVFVHGFNVTFEDAARRAGQIVYDLGFKGAPILYSWPSQGALSLTAYLKDGENAQLSAKPLQDLLNDLRLRSGARTVHIIAHSMGNRLVTTALANVATSGAVTPRFRQVALLAPDVRAELFERLATSFRSAADRLTLYASSMDEALMASQKLNGYRRAGQGGDNILVIAGVDSVDASAVNTSRLGLFHQYYADNRTILSDLFYLLQGKGPDERHGLQKDSRGFWRLRQ
jgi:esterase/lipase superfamily enzyme